MSSSAYVQSPPLAFVEELLDTPDEVTFDGEFELREGETRLRALARRADAAGMSTTLFSAPVEALWDGLHDGCPCVTLDGEGGLVVVSARRGRRVRARRGDGRFWWTAGELATAVGSAPGEEREWLALAERGPSLVMGKEGSPWRDVFALLSGERANVGAIVIYAVGVGLLSLALPLAVQSLVNTVAFGQLLQPIIVLSILLAVGLVFGAALRTMQAWMVEIVQRRLFVRLVSELGHRLPRAHVRAFERGEGPELVNRFFDVFTAQKASASLLLGGVESLLTATVGMLVLAFYHPLLLAFGLLILLCSFAVFFALGRGATKTTIKESKAKYALVGWLEEMVRHMFALKSSGGGHYFQRRLDTLAAEWLTARAAHFRVYFRQYIGALGVQVVAHASLLAVGGYLVVERQLTIGQLVAAELIVTAVVASLSKLGGKLESVYDLVAAADKLGALLSITLEEPGGDGELPREGALALTLDRLTPRGGEFDAFSLSLAAGESLAIHGDARANAALSDILFGLRLPDAGVVRFDGHDLRDLRLGELREHVAVVREPETLPGTIGDNVRAALGDRGKLDATEVWSLLDQVGLGDRVRELPRGLQTELLPSGVPLERQAQLRLTLARALAAKPGLLVLDGVLDAWPPAERQKLFESISHGRTLIALTQDASVSGLCARHVALPARRVALVEGVEHV